jgi:hypothetical protein
MTSVIMGQVFLLCFVHGPCPVFVVMNWLQFCREEVKVTGPSFEDGADRLLHIMVPQLVIDAMAEKIDGRKHIVRLRRAPSTTVVPGRWRNTTPKRAVPDVHLEALIDCILVESAPTGRKTCSPGASLPSGKVGVKQYEIQYFIPPQPPASHLDPVNQPTFYYMYLKFSSRRPSKFQVFVASSPVNRILTCTS